MMPLTNERVYPKFAFLVIANKKPKYEILKLAQSITWVRDFRSIAPVYYVYGNGKLKSGEKNVENLTTLREVNDPLFAPITNSILERIEGTNITFESVAGWDEILPNTIGALKEIMKNNKYDFLIRTNLSTYWNLEPTIRLLKSLPLQGVYAGSVRSTSLDYVEGDSIIISADTAKKMIANHNLFNSQLIDDLSIAKMLLHLGTKPLNIQRPWLTLKRISLIAFTRGGSTEIGPEYNSISGLIGNHSIRCKDEKNLLGLTIRFDTIIFLLLKLLSMAGVFAWKKSHNSAIDNMK